MWLITESSPSPPAPSLTPHPLPWDTSRGKPSCPIQTGTRAITMMDPILKWAWSWPGLWLLLYCMALCGCYYHTFFVKSLQCNHPVRIFTWTSGHKNSLTVHVKDLVPHCIVLSLHSFYRVPYVVYGIIEINTGKKDLPGKGDVVIRVLTCTGTCNVVCFYSHLKLDTSR